MATFEQLEPRQRAILELVIRRGQSYDDLSDTLGLPVPRVRELARKALVELAPTTASGVDPQWRGQLADYLLGQQTGPESRATQGHLRSSEDARMWAYSLVDSLDTLFEGDGRPDIPSSASAKAPRRFGRGQRDRTAADGAAEPAPRSKPAPRSETSKSTPRSDRDRERASTRQRVGDRDASRSTASGERTADPDAGPPTAPGGALGRLRSRQRLLAVIAGIVVLALVIAGAVYAFSGGGEERAAAPPPPAQPAGAGAGQPRVLGQFPLRRVSGGSGQGVAALIDQGGQRGLVVQARGIEGIGRDELLEVWFYNSPRDARSIGAQRVQDGTFQGLGTLPPDWQRFRFIDISVEKPAERNPAHSGRSILRGTLADAQPPASPQGALPSTPGR